MMIDRSDIAADLLKILVKEFARGTVEEVLASGSTSKMEIDGLPKFAVRLADKLILVLQETKE